MDAIARIAAIMLIFAEVAAAVGGNDHFAHRKRLAFQEVIEEPIRFAPSLSYEVLDPLEEEAQQRGDGRRAGSLWWEWTAPVDGWFRTAVVMPDQVEQETMVFTGDSLKTLVPVQNGNHLGLTFRRGTIFQARAGTRYQIAARLEMPGVAAPGNPPLATLTLAPCPGPPENGTLAHRAVLSGTLPLKVTSSNLAPPTQEAHLISLMTPIGYWYGVPGNFGSMQWWEWNCPATGQYTFYNEGLDLFRLVAKRRMSPGGPAGIAGDWETGPVPMEGEIFSAIGGVVYDFAVLSKPGGDPATDRPFSTYTLNLERVESRSPANTSRENAAIIPGVFPMAIRYDWPGVPILQGESEWLPLWWVFTAPANGIYHFYSAAGQMALHYEEGTDHSASTLQYLRTGEKVWMEVNLYRPLRYTLELRVYLLGTPVANDSLAQAVDLGSQPDFRLSGHRSLATLEPGELPPVPWEAEATGTLWWKWVAPGNGWLRIQSDEPRVPVEIFTGTQIIASARRTFERRVESVEAGKTYLIRAVFTPLAGNESCAMRLDFLARPENIVSQTAINLGVTAEPAWQPAAPWPPVEIGGERWFRWIAAESGRFDFSNRRSPATIFTNPETNTLVPRDTRTGTWELQAGQSYWLRLSDSWTDTWFEMRRQTLAEHTDPSSALVLPPDLPAAGTATTRGDVNGTEEIEILRDFTWESGLRTRTPAVWWKWQAPADQRVRCNVEVFDSPLKALLIFTGPDMDDIVIPDTVPHDSGGLYFPAKQGQTYWFAGIGQDDTLAFPFVFRLELWPVVDVRPANDDFSDSRRITAQQWQSHGPIQGIHHGSAGANPLRYEWTRATIEPGEPPVSLIIGQEGHFTEQTATTWWHWTAPSSGLYLLNLSGPVLEETGVDANLPADLTASIYTGDSLPTLRLAGAYESRAGRYCFRTQQGVRYTIRVASAAGTPFYQLSPEPPGIDDLYDFRAIEKLEFEQVGNAMFSDAGDGVTNYRKVLFGMDPQYPADHPVNAAALANLPRRILTNGMLEFRCRTDPVFDIEGRPAGLGIMGQVSADLKIWQDVEPFVDAGEVVLRLPVTGDRQFLMWDVLGSLRPVSR
jgi:hypothetical protein